jgi:hypothetical protein
MRPTNRFDVLRHVKTTLHSTGQRPAASQAVKGNRQSCFTTRIPPHHQLQTGGMIGINFAISHALLIPLF